MTAEMKNGILRQVLFMTMIEGLRNYEKLGVLDQIEKEKGERTIAEGPDKVKMYGISSAEEFLQFSADTFACADWSFEFDSEGFTAVTPSCVMCGMAKQAGAPSPCEMTCIAPVRGIVKGIDPDHELVVRETLWEGNCCEFRVNR